MRAAPERTRATDEHTRATDDRTRAAAGGSSAPWVGANLRRLRRERGISLTELAQRCGLEEELLASVEAGAVDPSIKALWGVATALGVSFGTLVQTPAEVPATIASAPPRPSTLIRRSVLPFAPHTDRRTEVHELKLAARGAEPATQYAHGTFESLLVTQGRVIVQIGVERHVLQTGDSLVVRGDAERRYLNPGDIDAIMYAVVSPAKLA